MAKRTAPPATPPPEGVQTLRGILSRFTFQNAESGFSIARFKPDAPAGSVPAGEEIVLTGALTGVEAGATLEVTGQWTDNPRFGLQFAVESVRQIPPATAEGIRSFLGSGLIAGIGKEYARRIVAVFGERTLEVIDTEPGRLHEVPGIGAKRFETIVAGWQEHRAVASILSFLQSYAISPNWASQIYRFYGNDAVRVLRENPYRLAIDLRGIGFASADKIAQSAGIPRDAPERIQAGVLHLLREAAGDGHSFFPFDALSTDALKILGIADPLLVRQATSELCKNASPRGRTHVVAEKLPEGDKAVYLQGLHHAERGVAHALRALLATGKSLPRIDGTREAEAFERTTRFQLADRQREAVQLAARGGVVLLTGGPGTGKTTTLRAVIHALANHGVTFHLAAPTGRAAKRLAESTRREAATLHRLLKWDPKKGGFAYNESATLPTDYLIVDEASMLDVTLTHHLLKALPSSASLLLVGDVDQLPSVGAGNVLRDLIASGAFPVVRLDTIFRQARRSLIITNAHRINAGEFPSLHAPDPDQKPDFFFVERAEPQEAVEAIEDLVARRIPSQYGFDPVEDIQVITPMHRGLLGATNLNQRLQALLNQDPRSLQCGALLLKVGDKVMQRENDYDKDVFNGDIGIVTDLDRTDHQVSVRFDRRIVVYPYSDLDELALSYAITVHKSQGSEYPVVVVPIHTQHFILLQRNLLYTAVTRGRKLVVCVGTKKAVFMAIKNSRLADRYSGLRQRLQHPEMP